jgi:hypothetical protein
VIAWKFSQEGGIDLVVKEEASAVYDWAAGDETENDPAPDTELQSALTVSPPTDVTISLTQDSNRLLVSWTAPNDPFVFAYQVEYIAFSDLSVSPSLDWGKLPRTNGTSLDLGNLLPDDYRIRVKSINTLGISSEYEMVSHVIATGVEVDTYPILASIITNTWTEKTNPQAQSLSSICWTGSAFVAVGTTSLGSPTGDAYIVTSANGDTWAERSNPKNFHLQSVTSALLTGSPTTTRIVAVGFQDGTDAYLLTSDDQGVTWAERSNPKNFDLRAVTTGVPTGSPSVAVRFVAVGAQDGADAYLVTSDDGATWTERSNPRHAQLNGVAWSEELGLYCAVGNVLSGTTYITTSPDGIDWTNRSSASVTVQLNGIVWSADDGLFIAGATNAIYKSSDGINWSVAQSVPSLAVAGGATWSGSIALLVGTGGSVYTSSDGEHWVERTTPDTASLSGAAWNGRCFVCVGSAIGETDAYIIKSLEVS